MHDRKKLRARITELETSAASARTWLTHATAAGNTELATQLTRLAEVYERQLPGCRSLLAMLEEQAPDEAS